MSNPTNVGFDRETFEDDLQKFGKEDGKGKGARVNAFFKAVEATQRLSNVTPADAKALWTLYATAAAKASGKEFSAGSSLPVQVSKFRQALTLGTLPNVDGLDVAYRAVEVLREEQSKPKPAVTGSTYDNLVAVARAQIARPNQALSDDEIRSEVITVKPERGMLDKMLDVYKRTHKLHDELPGTASARVYTQAALDALAEGITEMGGELPPVSAADKARAAVLAKAAKLGLTVVTKELLPEAKTDLIRAGVMVEAAE